MKIRTSLRAGGKGCSPETLSYMQKAVNMQNKVENCVSKGNFNYNYNQEPVYYGSLPAYPSTQSTYVGGTYPDRSGICG